MLIGFLAAFQGSFMISMTGKIKARKEFPVPKFAKLLKEAEARGATDRGCSSTTNFPARLRMSWSTWTRSPSPESLGPLEPVAYRGVRVVEYKK